MIRRRIARDFKLPIDFFDDESWNFYIKLYGKEDLVQKIKEGIDKYYGGEDTRFESEYSKILDTMMNNIKSTETYKNFITATLPTSEEQYKNGDVYNQECIGKEFTSMDLKMGNFQSLLSYSPDMFPGIKIDKESIENTYRSFLEGYCDNDFILWYFMKSKHYRQVLFGNCNPRRQVHLQNYLISLASKMMKARDRVKCRTGADEIIFNGALPDISETIRKNLGIYVKIETYTLIGWEFITGSGHYIWAYEKRFKDKASDFKCIPRLYYAQVYEAIHGIEPNAQNLDLLVQVEKEKAYFKDRLVLCKKP